MTWLALLWLAAAPAEVSVGHCPRVAEAEVRRLTRIELANGLGASSLGIRATVECVASEAVVRVDDPVTRKSLSRTIDLANVDPKVLARYLALAIAELVEASWAELTLPAPRVVEPSGVAPAQEARAAAEAQVRSPGPLRLEAFGVARRFPTSSLWQLGGGVRLALSGPILGGLLEVEAAHGQRATRLGDVGVDSATAALLMTGTLPLDWPVTFHGSVGDRIGVGIVTGTPFDPGVARGASFAALWLGPCAGVKTIASWRHWFASLALEGGLSLLGVQGTVNGASGPGLVGPWFGLSLGIGVRP